MTKRKKIFFITATIAFILALAVMIAGMVVVGKPSLYTANKTVSTSLVKNAVLTQQSEQTVTVYQDESKSSIVSYDKNGNTLWTADLSSYYAMLDSVGSDIFVGDGRTLRIFGADGVEKQQYLLDYIPRTVCVRGDVLAVNSSISAAKNVISVFTYNGEMLSLDYEIGFTQAVVQMGMSNNKDLYFATSTAVYQCVDGLGGGKTTKRLFESVTSVKGMYVDGIGKIYLSCQNGNLDIYEKTQDGYVCVDSVLFGKDASLIASDGQGKIVTFDYLGNALLYDTEIGEKITVFRLYASAYSVSIAAEGTVMAFKLSSPVAYFDLAKIEIFALCQKVQVWTVILAVALGLVALVATLLLFEKTEKKVLEVAGKIEKSKSVYIYLIPTFALLLVFNYYTVIKGFALSFQSYIPGMKSEFVGFQNFVSVFKNVEFWSSTGNMFIFLITDILKALIPPFIIAEVIHSVNSKKAQYVSRFLMFLPGILPGVAGSLLWMDGIFGSEGLVNEIFVALGAKNLIGYNWLGNNETAKWALVMFGFPWAGNYLLYYGALKSIPDSIYDAADLDGFSWFTRLFRIDMPMIGAQMKYVFMTTFISSIQNFSRVFITTNGAFDTNIPALVLYQNITTHQNYGVASAMGMVLFFVIFGMAAYSMKSRSKQEM